MSRPVIGLTCHFLPGSLPRSAVVQLYADAVMAAGGIPVGIPIGLDADAMRDLVDALDGLLLPGGDDVAPERYGHPRHPLLGEVNELRDELELTVAKWALEADLPVLGICRGIQVLAVAAGGTLCQDIASEWDEPLPHDLRDLGREHLAHSIEVEEGTHLAGAVGAGRLLVNSLHHQSVRDVPPGFIVAARAEDGVIEAIERPDRRFAVGIQCHPEGMWRTTAPEFKDLFAAFVAAAGNRRPQMVG